MIEPRGDSFRFVRKMMLALLATECIAALAFTFWAAGVTGVWSFATTMTPAILFTKYWGVPIILVAYLMQIPAVFMQADILSRFSYGLPQPELFVRSRRNAAAAMPLVCIAIIPGFGIVLLLIALIALMISSFRTLRVLRTLALHP
ncbi:MAG: hypothetical protein ACREJD_16000 [Phycisphaerales bacterium]